MDNYIEFIIRTALLLSLFIVGCEDVIEVELADSDNVYVVDGWISNLEGEQVIQVSRSQQYFDNTQPPGVSNADVRIIRNNDTELIFEYIGEGFYEYSGSATDLGNIGDEYQLQINVDGVTLSATTAMNRVPPIDSIGLEFRDDQPFSDDGIYANFFSRDIVGEGDTYWIKTFVNGAYLDKATQLNLAYDAAFDEGGSDGLIFITPIRELMNQTDENDLPFPFVSGDEIRVEIHSMSIPAFDFMATARDQITNSSNGIFALPLANAQSNLVASDGSTVLGFIQCSSGLCQ